MFVHFFPWNPCLPKRKMLVSKMCYSRTKMEKKYGVWIKEISNEKRKNTKLKIQSRKNFLQSTIEEFRTQKKKFEGEGKKEKVEEGFRRNEILQNSNFLGIFDVKKWVKISGNCNCFIAIFLCKISGKYPNQRSNFFDWWRGDKKRKR